MFLSLILKQLKRIEREVLGDAKDPAVQCCSSVDTPTQQWKKASLENKCINKVQINEAERSLTNCMMILRISVHFDT